MEKIQSALAKARASREGQEAPKSDLKNGNKVASAKQPSLWEAVEKTELNPRRLRASRVVTFETGEQSNEFDRLRTRILQRMRSENWTSMAIVSPTAQNGKSTVAANLAFSFARQSHLSTMLFELDLRRPRLAKTLGLSADLDVSRALAGEEDFKEHVVRLKDNLIVAPTHQMAGGTADFLQSPVAVATIDKVLKAYAPSVAIFDMPPIGAGDDVIGFLSNVDCALIVAAAGESTIGQIDACERDVAERTSVLGIVLNKCRYEQKQEDYSY